MASEGYLFAHLWKSNQVGAEEALELIQFHCGFSRFRLPRDAGLAGSALQMNRIQLGSQPLHTSFMLIFNQFNLM